MHRVARAGAWAFVMRITIRIAQLARTVILARILLPADFGLIGFAVITLLLLETLSRTGFRNALVQLEGDVEEYLDTAWTIEAIRGVVVGGIAVLGAPLIGAFFDSDAVVPVIRVMAITPVLNGFTNMALVRFDRNLQFNKVFRFEVSQRVTEVVVAISAALILRSVWALVIGALAGSAARVIASYLLAPRRPRPIVDGPKAKEMYSYGKWIYGTNLLDFFGVELDDILVGRIGGANALGLYRMAYTLSQSVVTEIAQTTNQVVFPAFARLKASGGDLVSGLVHSTHFVAMLAMPTAALFVVAGEGMVRVLLGDHWLEMVPALRVLAVAGAVVAVVAVVATLFEGVGRPDIATKYSLARLIVLAVLIYPAVVFWGLVGAAWAVLLSNWLGLVILVRNTRQFAGAGFRTLVVSIGWPVINSIVTGAVVLWLIRSIGGVTSVWDLILTLVVAVFAYAALVLVTSRFFGYSEPRDLLGRLFPSRFARPGS